MPASLPSIGPPVAYALLIWWFSTGLIIYLDNLPARTHRWSLLAMSALTVCSLQYLHFARNDGGGAAAYAAFSAGLIVWGWQEMSFFMGFVTGPVREACPPGCVGWPRFVRAVQVCLYHEIASLAAGVAVLAATAGGINQVGMWTYMALWWMRMSAKFNVFLGVRNLSEAFIPEHLAFIRSFLRHRPMNPLFPVSVLGLTAAAVMLVRQPPTIGTVLLTVLVLLGMLEHWFLVLPLPIDALWKWALRAREARSTRMLVRLHWQPGLAGPLTQYAPVRARTSRSIGGDP